MDKPRLRQALVDALEKDLSLQTEAARTSHAEAIDDESKPENPYDMHAQEAAYLAEGQAKFVSDLRDTLAVYRTLELPSLAPQDPIVVGAVIRVAADAERPRVYFIGPRAGGLEVEVDGETVLVITPASPLGRQLVGHRAGDEVTVTAHGRTSRQRIVSVG
jgi:transcription elongation GreA/GreB family factor